MSLPGLAASKLVVYCLVVVVILASLQLTQARSIRTMRYSNPRGVEAIKTRRGGCAAFGHSCFGGHGKRTEIPSIVNEAGDGIGLMETKEDSRNPINNKEFFLPVDIGRGNNELENSDSYHYRDLEDYLKLSPLFGKWLNSGYSRATSTEIQK